MFYSKFGCAEVADKEPTLHLILLITFLGCLAFFLVSISYPKLLYFLTPVIVLVDYMHNWELHDPHIASALMNEYGIAYFYASRTALVLILISGGIGLLIRRKIFPKP